MGGLESPPRCGEGSGQLGVPGARLFSEVPSDSTRGHGHKPKHGVVSLNIRKHFVLWGWQSVSTGCPMASPSLENFRSHLNNQVWVKLLELGGGGGPAGLWRSLPTSPAPRNPVEPRSEVPEPRILLGLRLPGLCFSLVRALQSTVAAYGFMAEKVSCGKL